MSAARPPLHPLARLVRDRGDEMSPSMRALAVALRIWLRLGGALGIFAIIVASLALMATAYLRFGGPGLLVYFLVAMPLTGLTAAGIPRLERRLARSLAARLERSLDSIGGTATPMMLSLRDRRGGDDP